MGDSWKRVRTKEYYENNSKVPVIGGKQSGG